MRCQELGANKINCRNNEGNGTSTKHVKNQKIRKVVGRREHGDFFRVGSSEMSPLGLGLGFVEVFGKEIPPLSFTPSLSSSHQVVCIWSALALCLAGLDLHFGYGVCAVLWAQENGGGRYVLQAWAWPDQDQWLSH